jgi:general secretion pathway protein I
MRRDAGISLVELIVAVLVLSIAVIGLFRVFDATARNTAGLRDRALALIVAENRAAELQLGQTDLPDQLPLAGALWQVSIRQTTTSGGFAETHITVTPAQGGPAAHLITYVAQGAAP